MPQVIGQAMTWNQKCDLAREAMQTAVEIRLDHGAGLDDPISAYSVCEKLGITVRFVDVNMEGVYLPKDKPRILVSVHRPFGRRHFTCAHEIGHHVFGHGASFDEIFKDTSAFDGRHPNEFLADVFAGHLLMPVLGVRRAFTRRGIKPDEAAPKDILSVATEFGVGYEALLTQLAFAFDDLTPNKRNKLLHARPGFRRELFDGSNGAEAFLIDNRFEVPTLDIEVDSFLVAPEDTEAVGDILRPVRKSKFGIVFRAQRRGIVDLVGPQISDSLTVRVAPKRFIGLAKYRYLEDDE